MISHDGSPFSTLRRLLAVLLLPIVAILIILGVIANNPTLPSKINRDEDEYSAVESHINELEVKRLIAVEHSEDTTQIDRELTRLRPRLEQLQPSHDTEMRRLEEEAQKKKEDAEKKIMKQYDAEQADLQKRCEAARSKRVTELTVNDLELLKTCGTDVQGVIPHVR